MLGWTWPGQRVRVRRDRVLVGRVRSVSRAGAAGRRRELLCLPRDLLPGGLFGITAGKAWPELIDQLDRYRAECFRVLWHAVQNAIMPIAPLLSVDLNPAEQTLLLAEAVASLARSHLEQTGRMAAPEARQTTRAEYLRPFVQRTNERLTALELRLSSGATIREDQAAEIALAVKAVAMLLTQQGDANGFGRVWGELSGRGLS